MQSDGTVFMWHLVTGVIGDCPLSEGLVGGQCLLWATFQPGHIPPWNQVFLGRQFEVPRNRDTGLDYVTVSGTALHPVKP